MVGGSKINITPESWVSRLMRKLRIFYGSMKIVQCILIIIFIILFILYEIQQLISNILLNGMHDLPRSTFELLYYVLGWGGYLAWGQHRPKSRLV